LPLLCVHIIYAYFVACPDFETSDAQPLNQIST